MITPEPAYSGIINRIRLAHGVPLFVPLREEQGWRLDLDALERAGAETERQSDRFQRHQHAGGSALHAGRTRRHRRSGPAPRPLGRLFRGDGSRLTFDIERAPNIATFPGMRERTIILDGVSKDYNMTAWRIGWAVG